MDPMQTVSYIGLVITIWDWIGSLRTEYRFIWRHSLLDLSAAQVLYLFTRYSGFLCHLANITLLHLRQHYIETFESPIRFCRIWLLFLTVTVSWTYGLIVTNMMLRVYALYNRDSRVIFALVALWIMRVALVITSWFYVIPKMPFSDQCIPQNVQPSELIAMTLVETLIQGIPVYLLFTRGAKIERAAQEKRVTMLVTYLRRDGVVSWIFMAAFSSVVALFSTFGRHAPSKMLHLSYPLLIALIPSLGCRLIFQIRKPIKKPAANPTVPQSFELDSLYESIWHTQSLEPELEDPVANDDQIHQIPRADDVIH